MLIICTVCEGYGEIPARAANRTCAVCKGSGLAESTFANSRSSSQLTYARPFPPAGVRYIFAKESTVEYPYGSNASSCAIRIAQDKPAHNSRGQAAWTLGLPPVEGVGAETKQEKRARILACRNTRLSQPYPALP